MRKFSGIYGLMVIGLLGLVQGQILARRLIMKDGSYQAITKYEVKGDRVRYRSAERNEWEEVPAALVDWDATKKYAERRSEGAPPPEAAETEKEIQAEASADRAAAEAAMPTVAPGLHLPDIEGIFLLDRYQSQPQLLEVQQNSGEINRNRTSNILRATINPLASSKQTIELKGAHAAVQAHALRPTVFINLEQDAATDTKIRADRSGQEKASAPQQPQGPTGGRQQPQQPEGPAQPLQEPGQQYRIVRMEQKKNTRVVGALKVAIYGKVSQQTGTVVPATTELMSGNWIKVTPLHDLAPGEYAIVEMLSPKEMNLFVWDFGINPSSPANPSSWKPEPVRATAPHSPTLDKRP
jgi:hypothetical protein